MYGTEVSCCSVCVKALSNYGEDESIEEYLTELFILSHSFSGRLFFLAPRIEKSSSIVSPRARHECDKQTLCLKTNAGQHIGRKGSNFGATLPAP